MFNRIAAHYLQNWLDKKRRKPLILRGARQVGKSTLVRLFAGSAGLHLLEVNLERHLYLDDIFKSLDMNVIIRELEALVAHKVNSPGTILFLDEIQATPHALQALRYFYEEYPNIPVIAAGSLLEFTLADHSFSMPVGRVEYFHLYPLTFREFLGAIQANLLRYLDQLSLDTPLPHAAHQSLLQRMREFFFVGGLPEAVLAFQETGSLLEVADVHQSIVDTYQDDFSKYSRQQDLVLLQKVFNLIPKTLGQKVKYSNISREKRATHVKQAIDLLTKARICHKIKHSHCSGLPLAAKSSERTYKLLFMDIGLANYVCGSDWQELTGVDERQLVNEGGIAEQFIGQHLVDISAGRKQPALHYWLREKKSSNAEVDYVVADRGSVIPVEVKAGASGSLKSLQQFMYSKPAKLAVRFDLNPASVQSVSHTIRTIKGNQPVDFTLLSLPLYGVEEIRRLTNTVLDT